MRRYASSQTLISSSQSFTLVELLLVVTIIAIMAGSIIPNIGASLTGATLDNATKTLSYLVRYVRSVAVERSVVAKLTLDPNSADISFTVEADPQNQSGVFEEESLPLSFSSKYQDKVKIAGMNKNSLFGSQEENVITFQPNGTTSDTFIYLTDDDMRVHTIGIVGITGQVITWDYECNSFYED